MEDEDSLDRVDQVSAPSKGVFEQKIKTVIFSNVKALAVRAGHVLLRLFLIYDAIASSLSMVGVAIKRLLGLDTDQLELPGGDVDYDLLSLDRDPLPSLRSLSADEYPALSKTMDSHESRFRWRVRMRTSVYFLFYTILLYALLSSIFYILTLLEMLHFYTLLTEPFQLLVSILVAVLCYVLFIIVVRILQRIVGPVLARPFADSACVVQILHLLVDLQNDDALTSKRKKTILQRVDDLARMTLLLALAPKSRDETTQRWAWKHFKGMELFIRERERWIIAPNRSTLANLRRDFLLLAPIYITRQYGSFEWENLYKEPEEDTADFKDRLVRWLKTFVGFILPLTLMGLYLWNPGIFPVVQLSAETVTLVFVAWLLLGLDALLDLKVVSGLVELAKGIKDLN